MDWTVEFLYVWVRSIDALDIVDDLVYLDGELFKHLSFLKTYPRVHELGIYFAIQSGNFSPQHLFTPTNCAFNLRQCFYLIINHSPRSSRSRRPFCAIKIDVFCAENEAVVELIPNGRNILVTNENKIRYPCPLISFSFLASST